MRRNLLILSLLITGACCKPPPPPPAPQPASKEVTMNQPSEWNKLSPEEERVIVGKGTERPGTGEYWNHKAPGYYICRRCSAPLYRSEDKFDSHCGWPSFDAEIPGSVKRVPDADGHRTEITCARCDGHLGHVFLGEGFTAKNTRHCVNSISMKFVSAALGDTQVAINLDTQKAVFSSGCFWGTEFFLQKFPGVVSTTCGYAGGHKENPTYKEVCGHETGHLEAVEIEFDPKKTSFEALAKFFFETHDFEQKNGQGPDIGPQYLSAVFCQDEEQKKTIEKLIARLQAKGLKPATQVRGADKFWPAESYHQDYYDRKGSTPYCHAYRKIFD
ncbi:MAG: hypothetical protein RL095_1565 [Verrucomicrobiota bacterium]|jgi:peptide methionine sulfoxide reductase msrA/msrB